MLDASEESSVRLAAFALLPALKSAARRSLLNKLKQDDQTEIRDRAELVANGGARELGEAVDIRELLDDLACEDYACWNTAVHRIGARGADAVHPLIAEMQSRAHDPEYCTRAGMALKALGRRRCRAIGDALDEVQEPLPLQVMVDVIGSLGEKHLIYRLKELIQRIAEPVEGVHVNGFDPLQRVRARAGAPRAGPCR